MTDKEKILKEIEKAKEHLANMEKMLEECEYERWKPKDHETYYCVCACGNAVQSWYNPEQDTSVQRYNFYNCFKTNEEAHAEAEKILIRRQLEDIARRLNKGRKIDWNDRYQCKFFLMIDFNQNNNLQLFEHYCVKYQGLVYCLDRKFKDIAIQEIGEERLKKYLRGE